MTDSKLSDEAKVLINSYLFKKLIWVAGLASLVSFFLGYFIKDIAKAEAYNTAYTQAAQTIIGITIQATESASKIKSLEMQFTDLNSKSEIILQEATDLKDKIKNSLAIQQSNKIVDDITENLLKNISFQNAIQGNVAQKINQIELKTKYIDVINGTTNFKGNISVEGHISCREGLYQ